MTDKELLERAAKAVGLEGEWFDSDEGPYFVVGNKMWDPLSDDGDALRLSVDLQMDLLQYGADDFDPKHACADYDVCEDYGDDPYAATRRAIVRAAAQLA